MSPLLSAMSFAKSVDDPGIQCAMIGKRALNGLCEGRADSPAELIDDLSGCVRGRDYGRTSKTGLS